MYIRDISVSLLMFPPSLPLWLQMVAHIFLFTDMLLITKSRKGGFSIAKPVSQATPTISIH